MNIMKCYLVVAWERNIIKCKILLSSILLLKKKNKQNNNNKNNKNGQVWLN
jgi:hypothetical protein